MNHIYEALTHSSHINKHYSSFPDCFHPFPLIYPGVSKTQLYHPTYIHDYSRMTYTLDVLRRWDLQAEHCCIARK